MSIEVFLIYKRFDKNRMKIVFYHTHYLLSIDHRKRRKFLLLITDVKYSFMNKY